MSHLLESYRLFRPNRCQAKLLFIANQDSTAVSEQQVFISWAEFVEHYKPTSIGVVEGEPSRPMFETFGEDLLTVRRTKECHVWSVVDVELPDPAISAHFPDEDGDNCWLVVAGYHSVNRLGYIITEEPWTDINVATVY